MHTLHALFTLLALAALINAQTETITANGQTLVVDVTTVQGARTTSTIRTIGGPAPNPIAEQPQTGNQDATYYWVTSTDANGDTVVNSYLFQPTFAPTSAPVQYSSGTILDYSSWTAHYATATVLPSGATSLLSTNSLVSLSVTLSAVLGGMLLVFA